MTLKEQIMFQDKSLYLSIFLCKMVAIVFIILQIFFATNVVLKIGEYPWILPSFRSEIFAHLMRLVQSRVSKKYLMDLYKNGYTRYLL